MTFSHNQTPKSLSHCLRIVLAACCGGWLGQPALAQQNTPSTQETSGEEAEAEQHRLTFDLGRFELREVRPTRNETTRIKFDAYFAMSPDVTQEDLEKLKHWKHRFRDQVIVAVRTAQVKDFHEPQLLRLRRIILFRVGRMMRESVVEDILFSEFTFSME